MCRHCFQGDVYVTDASTYDDDPVKGNYYKMYMFPSSQHPPLEYSLNEEPRKVTFYIDGQLYARHDGN